MMPVALWRECSGFMNAYLLIHTETLATSGGALILKLQSSPALSQDDNACVDVANVVGVNATGPQILKVGDAATNALTGWIRLKVTCSTAQVDATLRAELLLKHEVESRAAEWLAPLALSFAGSGALTMPADLWVDCSRFLHAFLLCERVTTSGSGSSLTVKLETAPSAASDASSWVTVASATMANSATVIDGRFSATNPPMGMLRLTYEAGGQVSGTLRVIVLLNET